MFKKLNIIQKLGLLVGGISIIGMIISIFDDWFQFQFEYTDWDEYVVGFLSVIIITPLWIKIFNDNGIEKIKSLFNQYCDFIGVENEGLKRILIILFFPLSFFSFFVITNMVGNSNIDSMIESIFLLPIFGIIIIGISLLIPIFGVGFTIKTLNWIIDGFKK